MYIYLPVELKQRKVSVGRTYCDTLSDDKTSWQSGIGNRGYSRSIPRPVVCCTYVRTHVYRAGLATLKPCLSWQNALWEKLLWYSPSAGPVGNKRRVAFKTRFFGLQVPLSVDSTTTRHGKLQKWWRPCAVSTVSQRYTARLCTCTAWYDVAAFTALG